jgi:hypothetical protein
VIAREATGICSTRNRVVHAGRAISARQETSLASSAATASAAETARSSRGPEAMPASAAAS